MNNTRAPFFMALALFSLGCALAIFEHGRMVEEQQAFKSERFDAKAREITESLRRRMVTYEYGLRGARGALIAAGPDAITRDRFRAYSQSREIQREFPGARGFGFIRRVPADRIGEFLLKARADGKPDFSIRQMAPHSGEHLIIQYIEPEAQNTQAVGLDIASESNRLIAALTAMRLGTSVLTKPITLVQAGGKPKRGFLLMLPIYHHELPTATPEQRLKAAYGLAYTPLVIDEILAGLDLSDGTLAVAIDDTDYADEPNRFFATTGADGAVIDGLIRHVPLSMHGREWMVEIKAMPDFVTRLNLIDPIREAFEIVAASALLTVLTFIVLTNRLKRRQTILDQSRLAAIVANSNDAIIGNDLNGVVTSWNKAAEKIFGYSAEQALGHTLAELIVPGERKPEEHHILDSLRNGMDVPHFTTRRLRRDGSQFDASVMVSPIRDKKGRVVGAAKIVRDITEQKRNEARILELNSNLEAQVAQRTAELRQATHVAEQANRAKSEFLANMSHEIRTPMNAVLGLCYLLEKQDLAAVSRDMVHKIHNAGRSLLGIINDILDFSKIEANRLVIESVPFRLTDVLDNLANIMASAVGDKPVEVVVSPVPPGTDYLKGDALRLGQVLINLAGNAIKFTESGEVVVSTELIDMDSETARLRFTVRDTGIGIAPDKQASIFNAFTQANTSTTRSFGGTGLGLTISRRLVEMMNGQLSVASKPGEGSQFSFDIPFELSHPAQCAMPEMLHQRILIADDQDTARAVLATTAASLGWHADAVATGDEAVEQAGRPMNTPYDVLLLDWRMPGLDGLGAAMTIRDRFTQQEAPIIIMATAYDRELLLEQPGSASVDAILPKPVTASSLYNAVMEAKNRRGELASASTTTQVSRRLDGLRVLVVDDSEINREVAQRILEGEGASVTLAEHGGEALKVLARIAGKVDIVLMDVQMPVMDGYTATRALRAMPNLAHLPVVALTAGAFKTQRDSAFDAGMNDFVAKPFDVDELIEVVQRLCRHGQPADAAARATAEAAKAAVTQAPVVGESIPVVDFERGLGLWREREAYLRNLRKFAEDHRANPNLDDWTDTAFLAHAHKMKGAAGNLALLKLANVCGEAEAAARAGVDVTEVRASMRATLAEAIQAIDGIAPPVPVRDAERPRCIDPSLLSPLLTDTLDALNQDNPDTVEPLLAQLTALLPREWVKPLVHAVENFDFRAAEQAARCLADDLNLCMEA